MIGWGDELARRQDTEGYEEELEQEAFENLVQEITCNPAVLAQYNLDFTESMTPIWVKDCDGKLVKVVPHEVFSAWFDETVLEEIRNRPFEGPDHEEGNND